MQVMFSCALKTASHSFFPLFKKKHPQTTLTRLGYRTWKVLRIIIKGILTPLGTKNPSVKDPERKEAEKVYDPQIKAIL